MSEQKWQPIETAPKDGSEIIGYREDCGSLIIRWTCPSEFMTEKELENISERDAFEDDWFYSDFVQGGRMSNDGNPTHWMPLPKPPTT